MNYRIDQSADHSKVELYQFLTGVNLPSFVKEAGVDDIVACKGTPKYAFADTMNKLFPINTCARVYTSNAYFVNKIAALEEKFGKAYIERVQNGIQKAAELFNIKADIEAYNKIADERNHKGYDDNQVLFKISSENDVELFSIKTAADVNRCATQFANTIHKYPFEWRKSIADQFVKAAESLNVDELPDLILKYAGQYYPNIADARKELERRMTKISADKRQAYQQLIDNVQNITSKDDVFKIAEICHYTEKNAGLYDKVHYRNILGDPVDKLFTLHMHKVAEMLNIVSMGGEKFAVHDLKNVPADVYEKAFGFALDVKSAEAFDILPTMPKSDVSLFKELSGVQPI
jgi:hypothetical protein